MGIDLSIFERDARFIEGEITQSVSINAVSYPCIAGEVTDTELLQEFGFSGSLMAQIIIRKSVLNGVVVYKNQKVTLVNRDGSQVELRVKQSLPSIDGIYQKLDCVGLTQ